MSYSVFFSIEAIGRHVDSANPESISGTETILELLASLSAEVDFFGIIDEQAVCLQVRLQSDVKPYLIEVPRPDSGGSYGAQLSFGEATKLLKNLPDTIPNSGFSGFEFLSW